MEAEVRQRFGVLPNFFRLASTEPQITINLWGFAKFAYLDNPLPSLFKERLFVYLSRFCSVRYCIARHLGFLVGLGHPSGDHQCAPQTVEAVLPLLRRPLPQDTEMLPLFSACCQLDSPLSSFPVPDSTAEKALIACATHVFLQTADAVGAHEALRLALGEAQIEYLNLFLTFVRTAHYWTKLHPELPFEEDVQQLLSTYEVVAQCVLNDPAAPVDLTHQVGAELDSLRQLKGTERVGKVLS
ncbi:MAG TPA: hypothetical protein VGP79_07460 [Bryobacteraceae bacterium]|nr:hypothetical protein [Bryobacteraceae bacterium]